MPQTPLASRHACLCVAYACVSALMHTTITATILFPPTQNPVYMKPWPGDEARHVWPLINTREAWKQS